MNLGLQDGKIVYLYTTICIMKWNLTNNTIIADNLAWKLSDVLNGYAVHPDELLDSYHAEVYRSKEQQGQKK